MLENLTEDIEDPAPTSAWTGLLGLGLSWHRLLRRGLGPARPTSHEPRKQHPYQDRQDFLKDRATHTGQLLRM
jgi:hypothetical protein